jgi:hypothetical protein
LKDSEKALSLIQGLLFEPKDRTQIIKENKKGFGRKREDLMIEYKLSASVAETAGAILAADGLQDIRVGLDEAMLVHPGYWAKYFLSHEKFLPVDCIVVSREIEHILCKHGIAGYDHNLSEDSDSEEYLIPIEFVRGIVHINHLGRLGIVCEIKIPKHRSPGRLLSLEKKSRGKKSIYVKKENLNAKEELQEAIEKVCEILNNNGIPVNDTIRKMVRQLVFVNALAYNKYVKSEDGEEVPELLMFPIKV